MYAAQSETMFFALRCICFYCCRVKRLLLETLYPTAIMLFCVLPDNNKMLCINFAPNMLRLAHFHFVQVRQRLGNKNESFKAFPFLFIRIALALHTFTLCKLGGGSAIKTKVLRLSFCIALALH